MRDELSKVDPANAATYRANAEDYLATLMMLNDAVQRAVDTIPPANRVLLTYHDSFAYFANHYGMKVIGAIQPVGLLGTQRAGGGGADRSDQGRARAGDLRVRGVRESRASADRQRRRGLPTKTRSAMTIFRATPGKRSTPTLGSCSTTCGRW